MHIYILGLQATHRRGRPVRLAWIAEDAVVTFGTRGAERRVVLPAEASVLLAALQQLDGDVVHAPVVRHQRQLLQCDGRLGAICSVLRACEKCSSAECEHLRLC